MFNENKKMSFLLVFAVNMIVIVIITLYELMSVSFISTVCFMYKISRISIIIIVIHLSYRFTRYNSKINLTRATFFFDEAKPCKWQQITATYIYRFTHTVLTQQQQNMSIDIEVCVSNIFLLDMSEFHLIIFNRIFHKLISRTKTFRSKLS